MKGQWENKNRAGYIAHRAVENALIRGRLVKKPCERCGKAEGVHAHHDDYSRPLDVMWLCPTHHIERHRELAASGGPVRQFESEEDRLHRVGQSRPRFSIRKLTEAQAQRVLTSDLTARALAAEYGCSPSLIGRIRNGTRYKDIRS